MIDDGYGKTLGAGGQEIKSNNLPLCGTCGWPVDEDNDSGWEVFTADGVTTQPQCVACNHESNTGPCLKEL